jgi:hypothetical protein
MKTTIVRTARLSFYVAFLWLAFDRVQALEPNPHAPPLLSVQTRGGSLEGIPVVWNDIEAVLLRRDGSLMEISSNDIQGHSVTRNPFESLSKKELKKKLQLEFGRDWEVTIRDDFVVVTPAGDTSLWLDRFIQLHRTFRQYFEARGMKIQAPDFPLVAIVAPNQAEFMRYASKNREKIDQKTLGYYSPISNRMILYDRHRSQEAWFSTGTTILHEATHQLAFNTGIHKRLSDNPLWAVEGLASLFESPGMLESRSQTEVAHRANPPRLARWKALRGQPNRIVGFLEGMIDTDNAFKENPDEAYAISWALSFYLAEREPNRFLAYHRRLSQLPQGKLYEKSDRREDFQNLITRDLALLVQKIDRFVGELPE